MNTTTHFDVIVIGAGPGGTAAAVRSAQLGANVLLIEKDKVGGTCLHRGCIPTKTLLHSAAVFKGAKKLSQFGVWVGTVELDNEIVHKRKDRIVNQLHAGLQKIIGSYPITLVYGTASFKNEKTITVKTKDGGLQEYTFDHAVIASGSVQHTPASFEGSQHCISSDDALMLKNIPKTLGIIGAGVLGLEFACLYNGFGSQVSLVEILPAIIPPLDKEISSLLIKELERQGIKLYCSSRAKRYDSKKLFIQCGNNEEREIPAETVIWAAGRKPCLESLNLKTAGIQKNAAGIEVNEYMRTSNKNVYAIGDAAGRSQFAYTASAEGATAAENSAGKKITMDYSAVPYAMYTEPNCAWVGLTEDAAVKAYGKDAVRIGRFSMLGNSKAAIKGTRSGMIKIITDNNSVMRGVHMVGNDAGELIVMAAQAVRTGMPIHEWRRESFPHPSLVESLFIAGEDSLSQAVDLQNRK